MRVLIAPLLLALVFGCTSTVGSPVSSDCARSEASIDGNLEQIGTAAGQRISATPDVLVCNHPGLGGSVDCEARGPGIIVAQSPTSQRVFALERGERAILMVDASGATCRLVP
jgi:hypothetical protein